MEIFRRYQVNIWQMLKRFVTSSEIWFGKDIEEAKESAEPIVKNCRTLKPLLVNQAKDIGICSNKAKTIWFEKRTWAREGTIFQDNFFDDR